MYGAVDMKGAVFMRAVKAYFNNVVYNLEKATDSGHGLIIPIAVDYELRRGFVSTLRPRLNPTIKFFLNNVLSMTLI